MPKILEMLSAAMPECRAPIAWAKAFQRGMERFPVQDVAMLFAQVGHESQGLTRLEEGLSYSSVDRILKIFPSSTRGLGPAELQKLVRNPERLANVVYAGKNGNGNSLSGDGWRFRGRGPIQTSCLNNYLALGRAIGIDLITNPDLLLTSKEVGALSALYFWTENVTDGEGVERVTRQINGPGMAGLDDRKLRLAAARRAS